MTTKGYTLDLALLRGKSSSVDDACPNPYRAHRLNSAVFF